MLIILCYDIDGLVILQWTKPSMAAIHLNRWEKIAFVSLVTCNMSDFVDKTVITEVAKFCHRRYSNWSYSNTFNVLVITEQT